ncbi:MAG: redox-regulated ATPase YchF [Dehalococcoidia bacterium]
MAELGIIGFGQSGKSTVFNAVTRGRAATGYGGSQEPQVGAVKVPDRRLDVLTGLFKPKKTTPAEIRYVDFPAAGSAFGRGQGPGSQFLNELRRMEGLIHVVRAFASPEVAHPEGSIEPARDIESMNLELNFADLALIERRLERLRAELRSAKAGDRMTGEREMALLVRLQEGLESELPVRAQTISADEQRLIGSYRFLTASPMLLLLNIGEDVVDRREAIEQEFTARCQQPGTSVAAFCGKLEMELLDLSPEEAVEYRAELGLGEETGLARAIRLSYHLLGLLSFLTAGEDEVRAWTVTRGATAPTAAGKIHSDLERGFIRAEVVRYDDLIGAGSMVEAKKRGLVRMEGKSYTVQDGDIMNILFNV